jgi:hypothetical protein
MNNLICRENFNWKKYVERYKDLKSIDNIDSAWNHWCEEGKKQGRKFFTLAPFKNNKYYIITKEYIKQKNIKLKNTKSTIISSLDDDIVIGDFVSNIKNKLKLHKKKTFICQTVNQNIDDKLTNKQKINNININQDKSNININQDKSNININQDKSNININQDKSNINNEDIEILEKDIKYTEYKIYNKQGNDEWTQKTENSEIFFLDFDKNNDNSDESKIYFSKKNPNNIFSNSD